MPNFAALGGARFSIRIMGGGGNLLNAFCSSKKRTQTDLGILLYQPKFWLQWSKYLQLWWS